jgi:type IV fimbrial biogenesis protein FimT
MHVGQQGWTLMELMIVLAVASLMLAAALPHYRDWIATHQLANAGQQLTASMSYARSEAIKRSTRVSLCRSADGRQCATNVGWESGWVVFVDDDQDGHVSADEAVLRAEVAASTGIRISGNRPVEDYISYTSLGQARLISGGLQMGTLTVCRSGLRAIQVVLANSGRVRTETSRDLCP